MFIVAPSPSVTAASVELWTFMVNGTPAGSDVLDANERRRAMSFVRAMDRARYITAHVELRMVLGRALNIAPAAVTIKPSPCPRCGGPHGRPALAAEPGHYFSLSHAGDQVMIALARFPVGVDIEPFAAITTDHAALDLAGLLHPAERQAIWAMPRAQRSAAVIRCWVRKEAYLKAIGTGIASGLSTTLVGVEPTPQEPIGGRIVDLDAPEGYAAAVACPDQPAAPLIVHRRSRACAR